MLRITVEMKKGSAGFLLELEGKLTGEWVRELERSWISLGKCEPRPRPRIDLTDVSYVDEKGKLLLENMVAQGAELVAHTPMMLSLARAITAHARNASHGAGGRKAQPATTEQPRA